MRVQSQCGDGSEVENMLFTEWNMKDALEVAKEEGKEEGIEEGIEIGEKRNEAKLQKAFTLWRQGYSIDEAERKLGLAK
jgi:predicted transposase YdaD